MDAIAGWVAWCRQPQLLRGGLGQVLKYLGVGGVGDKIFALTMGRGGSGVGEHPLAGVSFPPILLLVTNLVDY